MAFSSVSPDGDLPDPFKACTFFEEASKNSKKQSPPSPVEQGSVTLSAAAIAIAASTALPPSLNTWRPTELASGCELATMPWRAYTADLRERKWTSGVIDVIRVQI
mmetsp:Transcript_2766/g.6482  ORF Transcript_2766/g.6482 Transcript_2766/m.6482 type:complete len:106 (+) Transcript_2766:1459-1776(+)